MRVPRFMISNLAPFQNWRPAAARMKLYLTCIPYMLCKLCHIFQELQLNRFFYCCLGLLHKSWTEIKSQIVAAGSILEHHHVYYRAPCGAENKPCTIKFEADAWDIYDLEKLEEGDEIFTISAAALLSRRQS